MQTVACKRGNNDDDEYTPMPGDVVLGMSFYEEYLYLFEHITTHSFSDRYQWLKIAMDRGVYYCYQDSDTHDMILVQVSLDGQDDKIITLNRNINIIDMVINDENNIVIVSVDINLADTGIIRTPFYVELNFDGDEIHRAEFTHLLPEIDAQSEIVQALFTADGNLVLSVAYSRENFLYFINLSENSSTYLRLNNRPEKNSMVITADGRVIYYDLGSGELLEADFENETWGASYPVQSGRFDANIFPAHFDAGYDLLINDNSSLYGYILDTNEQIKLLNWVESGFSGMAGTHIGMTDKDRFVMAVKNQRNNGLDLEFYVLTPGKRENLPEKTTITLGCMWLPNSIADAIIAFNRLSDTYIVIAKEYFQDGDEWDAGVTRLQMELMSGRGPDIIFDQGGILRNNKLLLDLYPFIDADPEINREDFFPSLLRAMENPDGTLTALSANFDLVTMIGTKETVGHIENWTTEELAQLVISNPDLINPLGMSITAGQFILQMISNSGARFIDMENFVSDLDNEDFINVLEIAGMIKKNEFNVFEADPDNLPPELFLDPTVRLSTGEQLVDLVMIWNADEFQYRADILGDDLVLLGNPTSAGGRHSVRFDPPFAVNATTDHPDAAWSFIREILLPAEYVGMGLPIRIDAFEAHIAELQTPLMGTDSDGNPLEIPRDEKPIITAGYRVHGTFSIDIYEFSIYAMTDEVADMLRLMVNTAEPQQRVFRREITEMLMDDVEVFFEGGRTAADTARIIQNRVQIYLSESELLR